MSRAAHASFWFGIYVVIVGTILVVAPNVLLTLFGFTPTSENWIRVTGMIALALGGYYVQAGRGENAAFFRMSVVGRAFIFVGFTSLVLVGWSEPPLVLFGAVDLTGAVWTAWALRSSAGSAVPQPT